MIKKIVLIFLILIMFSGIVCAEDNQTDIVGDDIKNTYSDVLDYEGEDTVKDLTEIESLVKNANASDTIKINGTYRQTTYTEININNPLTIDGMGETVIDANNKSLRIVANSADIILKNLKIMNANNKWSVFVNNGELNIINCSFENINGSQLIYNERTVLIDSSEIKDCNFTKNIITSDKMMVEFPEIILKNSRIMNCNADSLLYSTISKRTVIENNLLCNNRVNKYLFRIVDWRNEKSEKVIFTLTGNVLMANLNNDSLPAKIYINPPTYIDYRKYGSTVLLMTYTIKDNFWGRNIHDAREFNFLEYLDWEYFDTEWQDRTTWCNVELTKINSTTYKLCYINSEKQHVELQDIAFDIYNKTTGAIIKSNIRVGEFDCDENISMDNVIIKYKGITINKSPAKITYTVTGSTFDDIKVKVTLTDPTTNEAIANAYIRFDIDSTGNKGTNHEHNYYYVHVNDDGSAVCNGEAEIPGHYYLNGFLDGPNENFVFTTTFTSEDYGLTREVLKIVIHKTQMTAIINPINLKYGSSKDVTVKVIDAKNKKPIYDAQITATIYKAGKKTGIDEVPIIYKGKTTVHIPKLDAGRYTLKLTSCDDSHYLITKTVKITVKPLKLNVKAQKVTNKYKQSKYFKLTVKKGSKIKINVKVYTGKKAKTYIIKTNKKGVAKLNTKSLKIGKHKVTISSANPNYKISATSKITII